MLRRVSGSYFGGNLRNRIQSSGFSPLSLFAASEPGVWYDPSDFSTMYQTNDTSTPVTAVGQSVGRIEDKSGRGNHATQATAASRPVLQQDASGRFFLLFDGVDDFLVTGTITPGIDKAQVFAGVRKLSDVATALIMEMSAASTNNGIVTLASSVNNVGNFQTWFSLSRGTASASNVPTGYPAPATSVLAGIGDIAGDVATLRVNGVQAATSAADQGTGNYLAYPLYIGRRGGTTLPFNGQLYGLIVRFGANLTADQITQTETWVNGKTGAYS